MVKVFFNYKGQIIICRTLIQFRSVRIKYIIQFKRNGTVEKEFLDCKRDSFLYFYR